MIKEFFFNRLSVPAGKQETQMIEEFIFNHLG
jgi:hypothetical protein